MNQFARGFALLGFALLSGCQSGGPPATPPLSGSLEPLNIAVTASVSAVDNASTTSSSSASSSVTLVNGRMPSNTFDAQRADLTQKVNASSLSATQKTEYIENITTAFSDLKSYIDSKLDSLPRRMVINANNPPLGASFAFTPLTSPAFNMDGLYNPSSSEYAVYNIAFAQGDSNQSAVVFGISGTSFTGALTNARATLTAGALGTLAVRNVGAVTINLQLTLELRFTRD